MKETQSSKDTTGAPEAYAAFTLPEGAKLEGEALTKAHDLFKGLGLDQKAAQSLVDYHMGALKSATESIDAVMNETHSKWKTDAEAHPDIGPMDGAKAQAIRANVNKALSVISATDPKLAEGFHEVMNLTGVGDNPNFIRVMAKLAEKWTEPTNVQDPTQKPSPNGQVQSGQVQRPTAAKGLYPNLP